MIILRLFSYYPLKKQNKKKKKNSNWVLNRSACPLETLDTTECMNGEQRPRCYLAHAQDDLTLRLLEDKVSHDTVQIFITNNHLFL